MTTLLIVTMAIISLLCLYFGSLVFLLKKTVKFQQDAEIGDMCYIYIGKEKIKSTIIKISDNLITVEDEHGWLHSILRFDIYPIGPHVR